MAVRRRSAWGAFESPGGHPGNNSGAARALFPQISPESLSESQWKEKNVLKAASIWESERIQALNSRKTLISHPLFVRLSKGSFFKTSLQMKT